MKPAIFSPLGSCRPVVPAFFDAQGMTWDFMGSNRKLRERHAYLVRIKPEKQGIVGCALAIIGRCSGEGTLWR